jgi:hypothetical protein
MFSSELVVFRWCTFFGFPAGQGGEGAGWLLSDAHPSNELSLTICRMGAEKQGGCLLGSRQFLDLVSGPYFVALRKL